MDDPVGRPRLKTTLPHSAYRPANVNGWTRRHEAALDCCMASRLGWIVLLVLLAAAAGSDAVGGPPLHEQIDEHIETAAIGPLSPICTDEDFVRRIYLDLTGVIPTAEQARAFVTDPRADKRQRLVDQLLASPDFVRHMTVTFDVLLMERKAEKVIKQPEWESYLYQSLAGDKPLDQLVRETIASDGADEKLRPAARFVLDRDAEPNLLTRDVGRLVFGMDLQCCQCHDHPLVDDYFQEDYYGLFAFVHRTSLFTDAKTKLVSLTEKAEGEASFKSVFTGASSDKALPRLPKGLTLLEEPAFGKGEEYQVKPDKTVRGVPKFSRRAALAEKIGESREFARNLANRLWAHLFGRGLVHPLDFHHAANPPSHPELLTLLADDLAAGGYKLRPFLRELALSRIYSRSCDAPRAETVNYADVAARVAELRREHALHEQSLPPLESALAAAKGAFKAGREDLARARVEIEKLQAAVVSAKQDAEKMAAARRAAETASQKASEQAAAVQQASVELAKLVAIVPDDTSLVAAAETVTARGRELAAAVEAAKIAMSEQVAAEQSALKHVAEAQQALDMAVAARPSIDLLAALEKAQLAAENRLSDAKYVSKSLDNRIAAGQAMLDYRHLAAKEPEKAEAAWAALVERWTIAGQVAALKPLTPEQLAASAMQACGTFQPLVVAADAKLEKSPPDELKKAPEADKTGVQTRLTQLELLNQLRGTFREFVRLYGGEVGQEFQATVNQALFFGNGTIVDGWLKPGGGNLVERVAKTPDAGKIADDVYWAVFSRPANGDEQARVAGYLAGRQDDKSIAIGEIVWALLGSTEFRFNH